jgi:hypothetical protein
MAGKKNKAPKTEAAKPGAAETNATEPRAPESGGMVTVAFNSPRGMVFPIGAERILINGNNADLIGLEKGVLNVGRFGYTRIPADTWEAIVKTYGSMAIFKSGLIYAEKSKGRAVDRAEDLAETRHGLEPVDITKTATEEATPGAAE